MHEKAHEVPVTPQELVATEAREEVGGTLERGDEGKGRTPVIPGGPLENDLILDGDTFTLSPLDGVAIKPSAPLQFVEEDLRPTRPMEKGKRKKFNLKALFEGLLDGKKV